MLGKLIGTKIGMTQVFDENRNVIPVTVVEIGDWFVTQIKTDENDNYCALQIGLPRKRYRGIPFSHAWLRNKDKIFVHVKELDLSKEDAGSYSLGQKISLKDFGVAEQDKVAVAGVSRGLGFQGVMKRWGFAGGPGGHGSTFHRKPGAIGNMCSEGNVIKGKKLPGHTGCRRVKVKGLKVVRVDQVANCLLIKGAVPGKKNTLLFIEKQWIKSTRGV